VCICVFNGHFVNVGCCLSHVIVEMPFTGSAAIVRPDLLVDYGAIQIVYLLAYRYLLPYLLTYFLTYLFP